MIFWGSVVRTQGGCREYRCCHVAQHYTLLTPKSDQTQGLLEIDIGLWHQQ
jgi:hypothetical protein